MSDMLERAARALCETYHPDPYSVNRVWPEYIEDVRAVLMAVREPDRVTIKAIDAESYADSGSYTRWQAGIDAILAGDA